MSSFFGTDSYAIDHKGRIAIPSSMRRGPTARKPLTTFFVNMGFDGCVAIWSPEEWARMMDKLRKISLGHPTGRAFRRAFMTDAREVSVDAQGRIPIPPALIRRAALGKEAVLHGAEDHIEVWNPDRFRHVVGPVLDVDGEYEKLAAIHLKDEAP
jgi:MraZ protein